MRHFKKIAIFFMVSFFTICLLELTARIIPFKQDVLNKITSILEQDSELFWKQKSNLDVFFEGVHVKTNSLGLRSNLTYKKNNSRECLRIVCLGASPTFGWGVTSEDAYSFQLKRLIEESGCASGVVEVINAGQIGYSSFQGLLFAEKIILNFRPDIVIVSYVVNDVDKYRFYRNNGLEDNQLIPKNRAVILVENFLEQSRFYVLFRKAILSLRQLKPHPGTRVFGGRRVSKEDYATNLNAIIDIAENNNIELILMNAPVGRFSQALNRDSEIYECLNLICAYNRIMEDIATEREIGFIDIGAVFKRDTQGSGVPLFVNPGYDFVHPSVKGHLLIAEAVFSNLQKNNFL